MIDSDGLNHNHLNVPIAKLQQKIICLLTAARRGEKDKPH